MDDDDGDDDEDHLLTPKTSNSAPDADPTPNPKSSTRSWTEGICQTLATTMMVKRMSCELCRR